MMGDGWRNNPDLVMNYIAEWKAEVRATVAMHFGNTWPEDKSGQWQPMFKALKKASRATAWKVIGLMADNPPKSMADAITALPGLIAKAQESTGASGGMSRDEAHAASQGLARDQYGDPMPCGVCGGEGIGMFRRTDGEDFEIKTAAGLRRRMAELPMACPVCPMGRWMAAHNKAMPDAQLYGDRVMTRLDWFVPAEVDEPRDVRAELRAGINREFSPARAG